tara:strand:+ start:568 stop:1392 length:825 start_codon:yes stop_codon:yes gene_type:complete
MSKFYYVTHASGDDFIKKYAQYAIKTLVSTGVNKNDIHMICNDSAEIKLFKKLGCEGINYYEANIDFSHVKWKYMGGKRRYAWLKSASMNKFFGEPIEGRYLVYFDGDVLFYKNPEPFLEKHCGKTWYHHGKSLKKRCPAGKAGKTVNDIDVSNYDSLSQWVSAPQAHIMVKFGAKKVPEYEVCSGFYILHPKDHKALMKWTLKGCEENANKFIKHEGGGEQKPMNAALAIKNIDWSGGSKFFCPDYIKYFEHFFGAKNYKDRFRAKVKEMGLK